MRKEFSGLIGYWRYERHELVQPELKTTHCWRYEVSEGWEISDVN